MGMTVAIIAVAAVAWLWLDTARARDVARATARRLCDDAGVQLLDQTVALRRTFPMQTAAGLRIGREFRFEFSEDGAARCGGHLTLRGAGLHVAVLDGDQIGRVIVQPQARRG